VKQITRIIQKQIEKDLYKGKAIIIYGPRQVGKTTLVKQIISNFSTPSTYLNCDEPDIRALISNKNSTQLKELFGSTKLVIFDEAQRVKNIGLSLKLIIDTFPSIQIIATGSSSFELANKIAEPLTGRIYQYTLFPLAEAEILTSFGSLETKRTLETRLRFGSYPEIISQPNLNEKQRLLDFLKNNFLLTDILQHQNIKGSELLYNLLQALALQIGQEVSLNELASLLEIDKNTVKKYISLLEKSFIIFKLRAFNRNLRKEINKKYKIYFHDTGLRNAIINNFNPLSLRNDAGQLWENYLISERLKHNIYTKNYQNSYFWRTYDQKELDLIEESGGKLNGFEFKWGKGKIKNSTTKLFTTTYPNSKLQLINQQNYPEFLTTL
jgi:uncharacterized protein